MLSSNKYSTVGFMLITFAIGVQWYFDSWCVKCIQLGVKQFLSYILLVFIVIFNMSSSNTNCDHLKWKKLFLNEVINMTDSQLVFTKRSYVKTNFY